MKKPYPAGTAVALPGGRLGELIAVEDSQYTGFLKVVYRNEEGETRMIDGLSKDYFLACAEFSKDFIEMSEVR